MGHSVKFVFRQVNKDDSLKTVGYIFLQRIENRKKTYKSIGLPPLEKRFWNEKKQRVKKSSLIDYSFYNTLIENTHREFLNDGYSLKTIAERTDNRSFLNYIEQTLNGVQFRLKHGTRKKYLTVVKKLKSYLEVKNRSNIMFKELTVGFLDEFQSYMLGTGMTQNSVTNYLKILHSFVRRSMADRELMNTNNPFNNFKFEKKLIRYKETLNDEEIRYLLKVEITDKRMDKVRKLFLFQFFAGGMRVSDLLSLRYRNFTNGRLSYRMFKTNHPIQFELSEAILDILSDFVSFELNFNDLTSINLLTVLNERRGQHKNVLSASDILNSQNIYYIRKSLLTPPYFTYLEETDFQRLWFSTDSLVESYIKSLSELDLLKLKSDIDAYIDKKGLINISARTTVSDGVFQRKIGLIEKLKNQIEERIIEIKRVFYAEMKNHLHKMGTSKETGNDFIFKKLKEKDFSDYLENDNFSMVSEELYDKINKTSIVYNRDLKTLQKYLNFNKILKSHLPRTTFTNIMMKGKVNHRDISDTLGHSSISITDEYLRTGFNNEGVDSVIKGTSDSFKD